MSNHGWRGEELAIASRKALKEIREQSVREDRVESKRLVVTCFAEKLNGKRDEPDRYKVAVLSVSNDGLKDLVNSCFIGNTKYECEVKIRHWLLEYYSQNEKLPSDTSQDIRNKATSAEVDIYD